MTRYGRFDIDVLEIGRGLWHAVFKDAQGLAVPLDGASFNAIHVRIAWANADDALADAKHFIDSHRGL